MPGRGGHALVGIGVAQHVEPVPGIAHAVLLVGQKFVHYLFVGIRGFVLEERVLLGGRGWNADQVQVDAPQQRVLVGRTGGLQSLLLVLRRDERVDRIGGFGDAGRNLRAHHRLEHPEIDALGVSRSLSEQRCEQNKGHKPTQTDRHFRNPPGSLISPHLVNNPNLPGLGGVNPTQLALPGSTVQLRQ